MVERVSERKREPEPQETIYDQVRAIDNERIKRLCEGKVVIKGSEIPWEQGRQGLMKIYSWNKEWDKQGVTGWRIFINRVKKHGGKHVHQGGMGLFVLGGKGYTVVDGVRYDWEEGDLIILPIKPDGCEHQHFNEDPEIPADWMAFIFTPLRDPAGVEFAQREDHPDWMGAKTPGK
ncbi:MAG: cupin domain-containing protein [Dehalococcoidia bacterium]|nr:cupin domain-containing protein [Dehalococcoidia bacterium]MDZ4245756.1 cupin domain-containing protein [Dehalococcoidia bacterium]